MPKRIIVSQTGFKLQYNPPTDESVDPDWNILTADDVFTRFAIQDCRGYGGTFAVNEYLYGDDKNIKALVFHGDEPTLQSAFGKALELIRVGNRGASA
jgi:hypothetical protein